MKKVFKVVARLAVITFVIVLLGCNVSKNQKIKDQKAIIHQYEEEYITSTEEIDAESNLEDANKRIAELEQQISSGVEDNTYINIKFPSDGNYYKEAYDEVQFYSDPYCTVKLSNVRFMSPNIDNSQAENGLSIYCLRMDNGEICYCTESPYLITEGKYNEMKEE